MKPSGIITLTTDFGEKDPFVGVMKGVILARFPAARVVDLTHQIAPQAVAEAAFWLSRSFEYFPPGTVHVAVVDPGVGTSRAILAASVCGHFFLAPDNGLLGAVLERAEARALAVVRADLPGAASAASRAVLEGAEARVLAVARAELLGAASAMFHGRDVFAPLAAELASGEAALSSLGQPVTSVVASALPSPVVRADRIEGVVVTVDRFGNLITNVRAAELAGVRRPVLELGGREVPFVRTYGDATQGEYVALVGSFDAVEIARAGGDAARGLAAGVGVSVVIRSAE